MLKIVFVVFSALWLLPDKIFMLTRLGQLLRKYCVYVLFAS